MTVFEPLVVDEGVAVEFEVGDGGLQRRLAADLNLLCETSRELRDETEDEGDFLTWFDDGGVVVTIELTLCIFEAVLINFRIVFEVELDVDCRVANIFDLDIFFVDVVDGYLEIEL